MSGPVVARPIVRRPATKTRSAEAPIVAERAFADNKYKLSISRLLPGGSSNDATSLSAKMSAAVSADAAATDGRMSGSVSTHHRRMLEIGNNRAASSSDRGRREYPTTKA